MGPQSENFVTYSQSFVFDLHGMYSRDFIFFKRVLGVEETHPYRFSPSSCHDYWDGYFSLAPSG